MSIFYDPQNHKTKPWVGFVLVILPILIILFGITVIYTMTKNNQETQSVGEAVSK
ncbi:MAG: hypothetical protein ACI9E5_001100 [Candidatus Omnitrophota bacterium]|jgi:hypothetical protein